MLTPTDLHMLRVQLYILDAEARNLERKQGRSNPIGPPAA
jgi:hypothetical protein